MHEAIYEKLKEVARAKQTITYDDIGRVARLGGHDPQLWQMLDEINRHEHQQGRPMLSAVVIVQADKLPGGGFFKLARELGVYRGENDSAFFGYELCKVHSYWSSPSSIKEVNF